MNKKAFFVILVGVVFGMRGAFAQEVFTWHLALVKNNQGVPFDKTVNMDNGESFNIELFSENDFYVYLVVEQASGAMATLLSRQIKGGVVFRTEKFTLNPPQGQEKFYVITSSQEQKDLQRAIDAHNKEGSNRNSLILKTALFKVRDSKGENPGKPIIFAGSVRGDETIEGTEYSGFSVYSKTIIIRH
jgi:hypothetical protein